MKKIIVGVVAVFLTGCVALLPASRPHVGGVANPAERLHGYGFSVAAPEYSKWFIADLAPDSIAFASQGTEADESFAFQVGIMRLPLFSTEQEFLNKVKTDKEKDTNKERFKILDTQQNVYTNNIDNIMCVDFTLVSEDHQAIKATANTDPMILKVIGTVCQHPQKKTLGVTYGFSQRFYPGHEDAALAEKAEGAKKLFRFEPIPADQGS